jgi:hypothetical protein
MIYRDDLHAGGPAHLTGNILAALFSRAVEPDFIDAGERAVALDLENRLGAGTEKPHHFRVVAREPRRDDRAGRRDPIGLR